MNREKEIKGMAKVLFGHYCGNDECGKCKEPNCIDYRKAERLFNAGYGNVKKAVKEFAGNIIELLDEMGIERSSEYNDGYDDGVTDCITNIKSLITELYGVDE